MLTVYMIWHKRAHIDTLTTLTNDQSVFLAKLETKPRILMKVDVELELMYVY